MKILLTIDLSLFLILSFFVSAGQTNFQPGYVITNSKDTLYGFLDYPKETDFVFFKQSDVKSLRKYQPSEIIGFRFLHGKFFVSKQIQIGEVRNKKFLDFLVDGIVDLYGYEDETNALYFIQRSDDELRLLQYDKREYISTLKAIFFDYPNMFNEINKVSYNEEPLMRLTKKFNRSVSSEKNTYYVKPPAIEIRMGPFVSLNSSLLDFDHATFYDAFNFQSSLYPGIGFLVSSSFPRIMRILSFQTSAELGKSHYYSSIIHPLYSNIFEEVNYHMVTLKGKAGFKFTYPKGKIRPSLLIGGNMLYLIDKDGKRYEEKQTKQVIYTDLGKENITPRFNYGYDVELGCDFHFHSSKVYYFNLAYSFDTGENFKRSETFIFVENNKPTITSTIRTFSVNAGFRF